MKRILLIVLGAAITPAMLAAEYSVFRVCEDKHVVRTTDGADAGRIEYLVLDPSSQRIVSTIVTGGVVGSKLVAVPFTLMQFASDQEIALTEITRERMISAPVIDPVQVTARNVIESTVIERTNRHFAAAGTRAATTEAAEPPLPGGQPGRGTTASPGSQPGEKMPVDAPATSQRQKRAADSGSKQPGQNPPGIAEKLPDRNSAATPDVPKQRNAERVDEPQKGRRKDRVPESTDEQISPIDDRTREGQFRAKPAAQKRGNPETEEPRP